MKTGEIEIQATKINVLNQCRKDLPFHIQDYQKVKADVFPSLEYAIVYPFLACRSEHPA